MKEPASMNVVRVLLITAVGPAGSVNVGVRSDLTPVFLAMALGTTLGLGANWSAKLHAPPRPGNPSGREVSLRENESLAQSGVADGDWVVFVSDPRSRRHRMTPPSPHFDQR